MSLAVTLLAVISLAGQPGGAGAPAAPASPASPAASKASGPYHVETMFEVGEDGSWDYLAIDPEAGRLYVPRSTRVMVLDAATGKTVGVVPDTEGVHGVALAPMLNKGFTSNGKAGTVTFFDLKTLKTLQTVKAGENPDAILFEPTTKRVFAFNGRSKDATVISASDGAVLGTIPMGGKPEYAVENGAGKVFVNVEDTSELLRIDAATMKVEARFSLSPGEEPSGLAIDPIHKRLFSVCSNEKMIVVDTESGKVLGSASIGKGVDGAAFDAAGQFALSSNGDGTMSVVSNKGDGFEVVQTLATAQRARTLVIDPKTRHIYLPTAEFEAPKEAAKDANGKEPKRQRPTMKPGTFKIVVVSP